jgi:UDP-N-acetylglucosamine 4-epimerase
VFGPRQDPNGPYAAVIPRWIAAIKKSEPVQIYGDGKTSRDFCYVGNAVQANILAGTVQNKKTLNKIYNVACGARTSLNELHGLIISAINNRQGLPPKTRAQSSRKVYLKCRKGDIRHSLADITKPRLSFGYKPVIQIKEGITNL